MCIRDSFWAMPGKEKLIQMLPWITKISRIGSPTDWKVTVSYTHLDVYKRQLHLHLVVERGHLPV